MMSRISIDVSAEDHKKLKALAALQGKTIKAYLLEGKINPVDDDQEKALADLESLLDERIRKHGESQAGGRSSASAILEDVLEQS